jgi:hypothetical protein
MHVWAGAVSVGNTVGQWIMGVRLSGNFFCSKFFRPHHFEREVFGRENYWRESPETQNFFGRKMQTGIFSKQKSGSGNISGQKRMRAGKTGTRISLPASVNNPIRVR